MSLRSLDIPLVADDGHRFNLIARIPARPRSSLLWLPALGVAARHYLPLAEALAARGVAVFVHEWRGNGSSNLRASRRNDWGYREILTRDLPLSHAALQQHAEAATAIIGGHSLGGQLAACYLGLQAQRFQRLWLVASGTPYWRTFPGLRGYALPLFYRFAIWISRRRGALPGRRLGFGGEEAGRLIRDWARVGLGGRYAAAGLDIDLEAAMAQAPAAIDAVLLADDWLAPHSSLQALLDKLPLTAVRTEILSAEDLQTTADHFAWMKQPQAVAEALDR
ncbi:alpha/beta hydrolase family protein [Pseudoxanthomonas wuyuanensis]|uniref:Predicted alpha/beta hydrolase n=1 Tax=Pseudoxanthomonas wuyuanensis TaxID=1073196 RepID=A0A286D9E4_9GAMM|nr:alpha/beta fold hydrolase [Pseudoxanthomonas wuyuanensis]KAF1722015.1 hypothetical protein CSC75_04695 [Pseudoxanthomonas wuyuanensis]SOD55247.1 Predicted alpha/beta hydrolase [Pseudoxanthomonas wuyuanensis]